MGRNSDFHTQSKRINIQRSTQGGSVTKVTTQRVLVLSCSQRKRSDSGLLPAIERYDGPAFRVVRRFLKQSVGTVPDIHILSARFGLIAHDYPINNYDCRMTVGRAHELKRDVTSGLCRSLHTLTRQDLLVVAGRVYLLALEDGLLLQSRPNGVQVAHGPMGRKLSHLHDWLYANASGDTAICVKADRSVRIRGVTVTATVEEVFAVARRALAEGRLDDDRYESWYVPIDGCRVATKWLVSQLTGLKPNGFGTTEARRVLAQLGVPTQRV
ncbi:MAG: DUF6884 domain-containing protein [Dehalococcoidia bacterium]